MTGQVTVDKTSSSPSEWLAHSGYGENDSIQENRDLLDYFYQHVAATPNQIAIEQGRETISYAAANARSDALAQHLSVTLDLKREDRIAIYLPRNINEVIVILAIIKLGCSYVPINPQDPESRIQYICDDTDVKAILTNTVGKNQLEHLSKTVIDIPSNLPPLSQPFERQKHLSDATAYIMYTSGTSGQPKGVMVTQDAIARFTASPKYLQVDGRDRIAQISNPAFDAATFEIWTGLLNGMTLVYPAQHSKAYLLKARNFKAFLADNKISLLFLTTVLFEQFSFNYPDMFKGLKYLLFGGERTYYKAIDLVLKHGKPKHLLQVYGITECTTFSTAFEINEKTYTQTENAVPIGQPIDHTNVHILDENLRPVADGLTGELYIEGRGLAKAYLNKPNATREKFITAMIGQSAERLYRTGDFGYRDLDGDINFLGRKDKQHKIRGHRIELHGIKKALLDHPEINQAEVLVSQQENAVSKKLVAYFVASSEISHQELIRYLKPLLPNYMIPSRFIQLDNIPTNANGKLSPKMLLGLQAELNSTAQRPIGIEGIVSEFINTLKETAQLHVDENDKFDLNNEDIALSNNLLDMIRKRFHVQLTLDTLRQNQSVSELTDTVRQIKIDEVVENKFETLTHVCLGKADRPPIIFVLPAGGNNLDSPKIIEKLQRLDHPCYVLTDPCVKLGFTLFADIPAIADCYHKLLQKQHPEWDNIILSGYSLGGLIAAEMLQMTTRQQMPVKINDIFLLDTWVTARIPEESQVALKDHHMDGFDYQHLGEDEDYLYRLFSHWFDACLAYSPVRQIKTPVTLITSRKSILDHKKLNIVEPNNFWTAYCESIRMVIAMDEGSSVPTKINILGMIQEMNTNLKQKYVRANREKQPDHILRHSVTPRSTGTTSGIDTSTTTSMNFSTGANGNRLRYPKSRSKVL